MNNEEQGKGLVFWDEHPTSAFAPRGHRNKGGSGYLVGFGSDEHGAPCGIVETGAGAFLMIRLGAMRRHEEIEAKPEAERQEQSQSEKTEPEIAKVVGDQQEMEAK
jgi:hypothetical protein